MNTIASLRSAAEASHLLSGAAENAITWLEADSLPAWAATSIEELVEAQAWSELNDRFYKTIAFGTGGMRGRTIGRVSAPAERGTPSAEETPEHAAVGAAGMNDFNVVRATIGLFRYIARYLGEDGRGYVRPQIVIGHDVRHFSRHFCELVASTWTRLGGHALIFDGPRSTPQVSFTVRHTGCQCGVVITASHNPPHDNGFKVYFEDGAQIVSPHAEGIITEVTRVGIAEASGHLNVDLTAVVELPVDLDAAYHAVVAESLIDPDVIAAEKPRVVFTPIHGTGGIASLPLLRKYGLDPIEVPEQSRLDPRFPSVQSPNPENAEALADGIALAQEEGADAVLATDPDCDRVGVAVREADGSMRLLTGNMIGSLLAEYRVRQFKKQGLIPAGGTDRAALIKTFVTTPMQEAIARAHGLKLINTLTGFKWIGEKLGIYQRELEERVLAERGIALDYDRTPLESRRRLLLELSTFYVFGGEESYGYLASDRVRDKDGNAAVLMFCELMAALKREGRTVTEELDALYIRYGYFQESLLNIVYEGAEGAVRIRRILDSYRQDPPRTIGDYAVTTFSDFGESDFTDADGQEIPKENFYFLELDNGYRYAVRGSGTEPKIKFYVFGHEPVSEPAALEEAKERADATVSEIRRMLEEDATRRAEPDAG